MKHSKSLLVVLILLIMSSCTTNSREDEINKDYDNSVSATLKVINNYDHAISIKPDDKISISKKFIYQWELKEDSSYELIAYPIDLYTVTKR